MIDIALIAFLIQFSPKSALFQTNHNSPGRAVDVRPVAESNLAKVVRATGEDPTVAREEERVRVAWNSK